MKLPSSALNGISCCALKSAARRRPRDDNDFGSMACAMPSFSHCGQRPPDKLVDERVRQFVLQYA